jgi:hypothetical protein
MLGSMRDAFVSNPKAHALTIQIKPATDEARRRHDSLQRLIADVLVNNVPYSKRYKNLCIKADAVTENLAWSLDQDDYNHLMTLAKSASCSESDRQALVSCLYDLAA